ASKKRPLDRLLYGLGIRFVGQRVARILADHYGTLDALMAANEEELTAIEDIGARIAQSVVVFFSQDHNRAVLADLRALGVNVEQPRRREMAADNNRPLQGQTWVVTGHFVQYPRKALEQWIIEHGGRVASSVSKMTAGVVVGEKPGSKLDKAQALNVLVLTEDEFVSRYLSKN
ncbi:MAG: helix-hairpin-helix domain-containing protein, partial [Firmicutes bacterium]|nr:helix-hairpin-helix domain-containing protein [Bacillota bacterium]